MSENLDIYSILSVLKSGIGILLTPLLHANKATCLLTTDVTQQAPDFQIRRTAI
jgi:hypothetical protein